MQNRTLINHIITTSEEFAASRECWNELVGDRLFQRWEWMYSWWEQWGAAGELAIVVVQDLSGTWVGLAPWYKARSASRGRVISALGNGMTCSDYVSVVAVEGMEELVSEELLKVMSSDHPLFANVDLIEMEGHLANDPVVESLRGCARESFADNVQEVIGGAWKTKLPSSWDDFQAALRKSFRRKTKKAMRRLTSGECESCLSVSGEEINQAWPAFVDLHQRRRRSLGQPGCFSDPSFSAFLKAATLRLAASGRAHINLVSHQGKPLACNLGFSAGDTIYLYQTGVDPERMDLEPGHINFCAAINAAIEHPFTWFDFLRGDEPYKRFWNAERTELYRTRFVPNKLSSNLRYSLVNAGRSLRNWAAQAKGCQEQS